MNREELESKRTKAVIYARVVGFMRPISSYNAGKAEEFKDRKLFNINKGM